MRKINLFILIGIGLLFAGSVYSAWEFYSWQVGTSATNGFVLQTNGSVSTWVATSTLGLGGGGTVTSVAMTVPTGLSISGSPITTAGTLALGFNILTSYIPFGGASNVLATSTAFSFNSSASRLTFTYASTTALSATNLCLSADCRTTWPAGGGSGTVSTSTNEISGRLSYWTSNSATPALLGQVATTSLTAASPLSLSQPISVIGSAASALTLSTAGDWSGTFDSQEGSYYLNANNLTNFGNPFYTYFNATTTDALTQGATNKYNQTHTGDVTGATALTIGASKVLDTMINFGTGATQINTADVPELTNLYYTDARVNSYIHASTTIPKTYTANTFTGTQTIGTLTVTGATTLATSLSGLLGLNTGVTYAVSTSTLNIGGNAATASSDSTWTLHNSYPAACSAGQYISALGDTSTCGTPTNTTYTPTYPITLTGTAFGLAFGTTTSNTWAGTQTFTNQMTGSISGNAGTASALYANPTDCTGAQFANAIDASGNLSCATPAGTAVVGTVSTSTFPTKGNLAYWTSKDAWPETLGTVATTSPTITAPLTYSGTLGSFVGGVGGAFACTTAASGVAGCLSSTAFDTFNNKQATISATYPIILTGATLSFPATSTLYGTGSYGNFLMWNGTPTWTATSTLTRLPNLTDVGTLTTGALGTGFTAVNVAQGGTGKATFTSSQLLYGNGTAALSSVATTTLTGTAPIVFSNAINVIGASASAISCTAASASVTGCLSAANWTTFNNKWDLASTTIANTSLTNSTISGIALGSNLAALTATNGSLTFSGSYTGATARTVGLNLGNANTWTALQTFGNASTTAISATTFMSNSGGRVIPDYFYPAFSYATSTAWTGTTTRQLGTAARAETWSFAECYTTVGTVNISFSDGTNLMDMIKASSTPAKFALTTNNTFTTGEKRQVAIGTPATSPVEVSCTITKNY